MRSKERHIEDAKRQADAQIEQRREEMAERNQKIIESKRKLSRDQAA